ncbi:hypothetical protein [Abyssogena phaseoliformis symbiont]|uniref:hypothetical protein n=1 Tax=Abyssogena phaseoliformis symbiont TaxID=596095 RepID=UPI001CED0485|nr:hypothetical protein [Abyssogena phaseoliformis symbiont]
MILLEGGNDILRSANLNQTKHNLSQMIELANSKGVQVVLLGVPKKGVFLRTADFYQQLADEYQLVFAKDLIKDLLSDQKYKSDLIRFNQLDYELMAQKIYQLLLDKGALE